jgi:hypothetical protein
MASNGDYPWISYEEISVPSSLADNDNFNRFKYAIYWYNFLTILMTVVPLVGTLTTTILGAIAITSESSDTKIVMSQTVISAITCFLTGISAYFRKFGMDILKTLAPDLKQYIKVWIAGVPITDYNRPPRVPIPALVLNPPLVASPVTIVTKQPEASNLSPIISFLVEKAILEHNIRDTPQQIPVPALVLNPPLVPSPVTIVINPATSPQSRALSPVLSFLVDEKKKTFFSSAPP